jgi:hypothetical protein
MDVDARLKALARLAQSKTDAAREAIEKELNQVSKTLESESEYDFLTQALDILDVIGYRLSGHAVGIVDAFIQTVEARKIRNTQVEEFLSFEVAKYNNAQTLVAKAIEVAVHLRYYETQSVLRILLRTFNHPSESVRKKAFEGLSAVASYDLDVFYGSDRNGGIGAAPQQQIIDTLEIQSDPDLKAHFPAALKLLDELLSPSMEGATWSSTALTLSRGATPALPSISAIRQRSIRLLCRMFGLAATKSEKLRLINTLHSATRTNVHTSLDENASEMIVRDATDVLAFYARLVPTEDFQIVQKIEHNSYWIFVHAHREEIRTAALSVEKALATHREYHIYRVLVGFEGVFSDWATLQSADTQWGIREKERRDKASELARSVTPETYPEWRARILACAKTESDDLATFPVFYQFLDELAATHPELALTLVTEDTATVARFLIPLLHGLWGGSCKDATRNLIEKWIKEAKAGKEHHLFAATKLFLSTKDVDVALLGSLVEKAVEIRDIPAVRQVVAVAIVRYPMAGEGAGNLKELLFRALEALTAVGDASWVYDAWFRDEARQLFAELQGADLDNVLRNLKVLPKIDYHADELLARIAERAPERVIQFFCERLSVETKRDQDSGSAVFEAVPYEFHKLHEPLSKAPNAAVRAVLARYRADSSLFAFRGARLLHNIFPKFSEKLEAELLQLVWEGGEANYGFVLGILRNYQGEPFIHRLCKEIVKAIPDGSGLRTEVAIALETTGMVSGAFGMSEAYERKRKEVLDWLADPDERVQNFAKWYIGNLEHMRDAERKRAEEDIALRKFQFGEE